MKQRIFSLLLCICVFISIDAQQKPHGVPFNGIIMDIMGTPLRGAKIFVVSPRVYTRSNKKGHFGLTDVNATDTLHVIYKKTEYIFPIEGRKSIRIKLGDQLSSEIFEDQDLVNWGYGFVKRRESIEVSNGISGEELARTGYVNLLDALVGQIPNLRIISSNRPGQPSMVNIRGINSLNCSTTPLFVVDGTIVESLDFINVHDVDHVEILKESSIYGSRGANGAILVTTKRGL